ncbi:hypothetical protein ANN_13289 [Periplaneta americana]|uniref:Uncharacterized protein n=1 Tax=Periplaneta americana TaxID=6978 RepID=A0ABQ8TJE5_PERAM|nr:hypothetical protein ANN_13289 [Periplaneta americana]
MAGLCEGGNEPPGSLKAICNRVENVSREHIVAPSDSCAILLLSTSLQPPPSHSLESNSCAVSSTQKFLVQQHITTSKHQANKQLNSKQRQLFLTQPTTSNGIPEKYTQHTIPDESTLRKTYAPSIYDETIQKIRDEIKDSSIWVSIDETPDKEVMETLGLQHRPDEWRLFIDSSKVSLKAVLLHIGNELPSIPVAHVADMKETYQNMKVILEKIQYGKHEWYIYGDLKVIALLLGLQLGFTKFCCFLCLWDNRDRKSHYVTKSWPKRESHIPGQKDVSYVPLVNPEKILLPPLHIKLGVMKNVVKAMDKQSDGFLYLKSKFPKVSDAKLKAGIFIGPQIQSLMGDDHFEGLLNPLEKAAW